MHQSTHYSSTPPVLQRTAMKTLVPALLAVFALSSVHAADSAPPGAPLPAVSVEEVRTLEKSAAKTFIGTVSGSETVNIVPRVSGTLWKVAFREGAMVKKGDVLFEIEDTVYKANVLVAEALIQQAEADLELAIKEHERSRELLKSKAISTQSFDSTLATQLLKEARLAEAKANLVLAQHDLDYCRIVSPLTGRIGEKLYSEGNYITPSLGVLATVVRFQPCKVQFSMSESDFFHYFRNRDELRNAQLDILRANGDRYTGKAVIDFVDNIVDRRTDTLMITLECNNPGDQLLPGGFVQIRMAEMYPAPLPAVSISALMTDGTNHYVFVARPDDTVERRIVHIGDVVDRYQIITQGLEPGERVLVGGMNKVTPGMKVNPVMSGQQH